KMRERSKNFGSPESHLKRSGANVIVYFFGFNESFAGEDGIAQFEKDLTDVVNNAKSTDYGKGNPRVVLVSPIAFEQTGDPNLPDATEPNQRLQMYTRVIRKVAESTDSSFVNLFAPTKKLFAETEERLTLNGSHLNANGYLRLAPIFQRGLFGKAAAANDKGGMGKVDPAVKAEIDNKNFHWWHRYRAVNGFSIYGDRGLAGTDGTYNNRMVMEREREILDQMTANRDARIWTVASGGTVPGDVDDSNTLPFINPKTNVGGPNDKQRKAGKLGSLDYLTAEEQAKLFEMRDGYEIQLVASEEMFPELANPVAIDFDSKGRLYVATMPSYPQWKPKTVLDDKILMLEDTNGDGVSDNCKTVARGLHQPTGFEITADGIWVAQQPDILWMQDTDGDDVYDTRVRKLVGFDSADSHHGIAAFTFGPGGQLYFQEGTFKFSQVESPYGLTRLNEAGIWRYDPRTEKLGVHANLAFANPWGHVFDRWGQDFIGDASPGWSYWATPITGQLEYPSKHPGGSQHRRVAKVLGDDPKISYPRFYKKRIRPLGGCEIISSSHFPDDVQGNWLVTNCIGERTVLNHEVKEEGSGFVGTEVAPIVSSKDGNFRPVDVQIAPDGSLYIIDWHNALIGHLQHNLREPYRDHSHGRIWRVTYKGRPLVTPPKIDGASIADLLDVLKHKDNRIRYAAKRELAIRPSDDVMSALKTWVAGIQGDDEDAIHARLEALWVSQMHNQLHGDLLEQMLTCGDHRARAAAVRVMRFKLDDIDAPVEKVKRAIGDDHPRVRMEALIACTHLPPTEELQEIVLGVAEKEMDAYLEYALEETLRLFD
ncbi:MAG: PVC-type heme-binding CxxCH protein, partial [Planctomycetota bacterium]